MLAPLDLQKMLAESPGAVLLLDVREQSEYEEGHIPGASSLPLSRIAAGPVSLERGKRIVIYCASGARNYNAWRILTRQGYRVYFQAAFAEWKSAGLPVEKPEPTKAR